MVQNTDGYLTCAWRRVPPPRVGNLTAHKNENASCRVLHHTTFLAPQYTHKGDPIARIPLRLLAKNSSAAWSPAWNLSGDWTQINGDGTVYDDLMRVRLGPRDENGTYPWNALCVSGGPDGSCEPVPSGRAGAAWTLGNGTFNATALTIANVHFDSDLQRTYSAIVSADAGRLEFSDHSFWVRIDLKLPRRFWVPARTLANPIAR